MKKFAALISFIALLGVGTWAILSYQHIVDRFVVATYQPSSQMQRITDTVDFTDGGKFYFFAAQPALNDRQEFNQNCKNRDKESIILGCYISPQHIFIFRVDDDRLQGVEEVTSAHEMLHVAYDRMGGAEKNRVNKMLENELSKVTDEKMQKRLEVYERTEPGEKYNELHSIIGTEVVNLSPELEKYYSQYFKDRQVIAEMAKKYEQMFNELGRKQDGLVAEIEQLAAEHNQKVADYNAASETLSSDITDFNQKARSGYFDNDSDFEAARSQLIARQNQLESQLSTIRQIEKQYDQKRAQLNAVGNEAESLNRSLDSRLQPVPSL